MNYYDGKSGFITVISGPMCSEKTATLITRCKNLEKFAHKKIIGFKPSIDTRFGEDEIVSRLGLRMKATTLPPMIDESVYDYILEKGKFCDIVAFDEAQFYNNKIIDVVNELAWIGKHIVLCGLNTNFRGKTYRSMGDLIAMSDEHVQLIAYCSCCGRPAIFNQRLKNGEPVEDGPLDLIENVSSNNPEYTYEPRCRLCFVPPHKVNHKK